MKTGAFICALTLCVFAGKTLSAQKVSVSWKEYLGAPDSSHYSPLKQITPANVGTLDIAWSYPSPVPENPRIAGLICFRNEWVDLVVDGERLERPVTPWS